MGVLTTSETVRVLVRGSHWRSLHYMGGCFSWRCVSVRCVNRSRGGLIERRVIVLRSVVGLGRGIERGVAEGGVIERRPIVLRLISGWGTVVGVGVPIWLSCSEISHLSLSCFPSHYEELQFLELFCQTSNVISFRLSE